MISAFSRSTSIFRLVIYDALSWSRHQCVVLHQKQSFSIPRGCSSAVFLNKSIEVLNYINTGYVSSRVRSEIFHLNLRTKIYFAVLKWIFLVQVMFTFTRIQCKCVSEQWPTLIHSVECRVRYFGTFLCKNLCFEIKSIVFEVEE